MYAIVEIAGQQFKVEKDQQIFVHRLDAKQGTKVSFDKVLLTDDNGKVNVGSPLVKGMSVTAKVMEHLKGDKVIVFKKKRRKGYKVKNYPFFPGSLGNWAGNERKIPTYTLELPSSDNRFSKKYWNQFKEAIQTAIFSDLRISLKHP